MKVRCSIVTSILIFSLSVILTWPARSLAWQSQAVESVSEFVRQHPGVRFHGAPFYRQAGATDESRTFGAVYGTALGVGATPVESAWNHINQIAPLLGDDWGSLVPQVNASGEVLLPLMAGPGQEPRFYTFRFNQQYQGLPVFRSGVGFLVRNEPGNPLVVSGIDVKNLPGFAVGQAGTPTVTPTMLKHVADLMNQGDEPELKSLLNRGRSSRIVVTEPERVIFAGVNGESANPEVAVKFMAERGSIQTLPDYDKYLILASASSGKILLAETQIHEVDINGSVRGRATSGLASLECNPEIEVGLPYAEANVVGGNSTFADASGNFTIPHGGSAQVNVRSRLRGQWFEVFDQQNGNAIPEIIQAVTPPGPASFLHNPVDTEFSTSNVNAYLESNVVRDFVLNYQPTYPVIGTQTFFDVNTNINANCNAFYNGSSINFYIAGGGCNNTSFSDVIYHEYGHHLINVTGNGQGELGEGSGDVMGVLIQDDPILGNGFQGNCGAGIRSAANTLQYPCSGGIHFCGQVISGAVWDTRNQLAITEPSSFRDINATLFLGMLMVRGQMLPGNPTIDPFITVLYLELDDDDSNIGNGTPHYNEIAAGFGLHNLDAPPLALLEFDYPAGRPELIPHNGGAAFTVRVLAQNETPAAGSGVLHVDRGSGFEAFPMTEVSPNLYQAVFPNSDCGAVVNYYVSAETTGGMSQQDPSDAPQTTYSAMTGTSVTVGFSDNFESDLGWSVSGDSLDGQWNRGTPVGGGDRGDPPTDGDGSGQCFLTDNVDGNSDVDDGSTILTSPLMDATAAAGQVAVLRYRRWYSNNVGADPENDIFVVEISNDGGTNWTNLEVVGPTGPEVQGGWIEKSFRISDVIPPTSQMRVRFNASDLTNPSVVEAAVDSVQIAIVTCDPPAVMAEGSKLLDGVVTGGPSTNMNASDDQYLAVDPSPTVNPVKQKIELVIQSTSPVPAPATFRFRLEAKKLGGPVGDVVQFISLLNYQTGSYELVDMRPAENTDTSIDVMVTGDPSRFVQAGTREITARMGWLSESFSGSPFTWSIDLDEAVWLID